MEAKKLYKILKGPYEIIGKQGEYYQVDDISDILLTFGGRFDHFFTFNMNELIESKPEKPDISSHHAFNGCTSLLKRLADDFLNNNEYYSKEMDIIKSISTDLLTHTHFIKTKDSENGDVKKHYFSQNYFLIKHKYYYNELASFDDNVLHLLLSKVAKNNERGFNYFYEKLILNQNTFRFRFGFKRSGYKTFRSIHTTPERRWNIAHVDEHGKQFVRGARRNLPDSWDDYVRCYQRTWKEKKIKKQWMKRLNRHQDTAILKSLESDETSLHDLLA